MTSARAPLPTWEATAHEAVQGRLEAEARTRLVIDQAPDVYASVDESGAVLDWNPAAAEIFGWSRDEVLGGDLGVLLLNARRSALHRSQVDDFKATGSTSMLGRHPDVPMSHRDGRLLHIDCVVWSVVDEHGRATLHTFMTDVTARRAAADDLRRANDDLSVFSAAMAHDLRTPLTVIKGLAQLLERELGPDHPEPVDWAARIDAAADRGVRLVEDVLHYLSIGRAPVTRALVVLTSLVRQVAADQVGASGRAADVEVRALPAILGDAGLLSQLFGNLIGNALKHAPADRPVVVVVDASHSSDDTVVVGVQDNGDPVLADDLERIFRMFERGTTAGAVGGSGVGLAVCRRIAELHDGAITIETPPSGGNRFCVRLGL